MKDEEIRKVVREGYAEIARQGNSCCAPSSPCCSQPFQAEDISKKIGYSNEEITSVPEGANLGLGCGNPTTLASLNKVIGVDMTPEMIASARANAEKGGYENVEFRLGEIENLPAADNSIDAIISNCVINLSPDKRSVFLEAFRVLKPGGRLMVSDIVLLKELPGFIRESVAAYVGCISGAMLKNDYLATIRGAGFQGVKVLEETPFPIDYITNDPLAEEVINKIGATQKDIENFADSVVSVKVQAVKPE